MKGKTLYAAYGSNMNLEQMERRCPNAKIFAKGVIEGYELEFRGFSSWGGGVATVAPNAEENVPVLLWELTEDCEKSLDIYEGYPSFYYKKKLWVKLEDGRRRKCMAYVMTDGHKISYPSESYLNGIAAGYRSADIDPKPLNDSLQKILENSCKTKAE